MIKAKNLSVFFGLDIFLKNEGQNPTGSFKDREYSLVAALAKELGHGTVSCASSGNAAVSLSAYAAKHGLECVVFVPSATSKKKLMQIEQFGAELKLVGGSYEDAFELSNKTIAENNWYNCNSGINPLVSEGNKATAYEICRTFGVPDKIIIPVGNGTHLTGIWKGFKELYSFGKAGKLPSMIGVQIEGADPVTRAFNRKLHHPLVVENPAESIAEAIVAKESYDGIRALEAIYGSNGLCVSVNDSEIKHACKLLAQKEGTSAEISSASVVASIPKLRNIGVFGKADRILCIITGHGLKNEEVV